MISPLFHFLSKQIRSLLSLIAVVGLLFGTSASIYANGLSAERPIVSVNAISGG